MKRFEKIYEDMIFNEFSITLFTYISVYYIYYYTYLYLYILSNSAISLYICSLLFNLKHTTNVHTVFTKKKAVVWLYCYCRAYNFRHFTQSKLLQQKNEDDNHE